ncbi:MAG TPA: T9SS type A sorting domain-containing protein [Chitinophagaceae bacterium]|nr:T9SS type A sorting domain-containing protein [Chitinophagaceae bacterium]
MKKIFLLLLLAAPAVNGFTQICVPRDLSFGTGGTSYGMTAAANSIYTANIVIQPDGKIIQAVNLVPDSAFDFCLIRYKANGGLDSTFGTNGKATGPVGTEQNYIQFILLLPDGKIIAIGTSDNQNGRDFTLFRYNNNGTPDSSFGVNGQVVTKVGLYDDHASHGAVQSDGKIVVAGSSVDVNYVSAFAVVRYNPNGGIDSSFGQNGKIVTHLGHFITYIGNTYYGQYSSEYASNVLIQTDGKIIVGGQSYSHEGCYDYYGYVYCNPVFAMTRFNSNGSTDSSFGKNGKAVDSTFLFYPAAMQLQADDKIVVTGANYYEKFLTERFTNNGRIDSSFGVNGQVATVFCMQDCQLNASSLAIQSDGKIVVAGSFAAFNESQKFTVLRFETNGSADNTFNGNGTAIFHVDPSGSNDILTGLGIQNNKIVVGGYSLSNTNQFRNAEIVRLFEAQQMITPVITPGGSVSICFGSNVTLTSDQTGVMHWYKDGVPISGATGSTYTASVSGSYTVQVSNASGCGTSLPLTVTVNGNPIKPPIFWNTPQFSTNPGYTHYEWMLNGNPIAGNDTNIYKPSQTGWYKVAVTNNNGCRTVSDSFNLVVLAVADITVGNARLRYYPNPAKTVLNIDVINPGNNKLEAELYDVTGRLVMKQILNQRSNQLQVDQLSSGLYQLLIYNDHEKMIVKVVVIK